MFNLSIKFVFIVTVAAIYETAAEVLAEELKNGPSKQSSFGDDKERKQILKVWIKITKKVVIQ